LDRGSSRLHLPARELGTVVGKDQFEIAHDLFRVPRLSTIIHSVYKVLRARLPKPAVRVSYTISLVMDEVEGSMKQRLFVDCKELLSHVLRTKKRPDNLVSSSD
jgi:hypothetical protein